MHEFESTSGEKPPTSRTVVLYDPDDGRVVYTHEFIGDGDESQSDRERIALDSVKRHRDHVGQLRALHLPANFRRELGKVYRVDAQARSLVVRGQMSLDRREKTRIRRPADDR
jgi:hypothetical protein